MKTNYFSGSTIQIVTFSCCQHIFFKGSDNYKPVILQVFSQITLIEKTHILMITQKNFSHTKKGIATFAQPYHRDPKRKWDLKMKRKFFLYFTHWAHTYPYIEFDQKN